VVDLDFFPDGSLLFVVSLKNGITVYFIPEPGSLAFLMLAVLALWLRRC